VDAFGIAALTSAAAALDIWLPAPVPCAANTEAKLAGSSAALLPLLDFAEDERFFHKEAALVATLSMALEAPAMARSGSMMKPR
jgi:hypothetical protein